MIRLRVQDIIDERNISRYELNKSIRISSNNLSKMLKNETKSIKYEYIEAFCEVLNCEPNDLFEITYDENK